MNKIPNRQAMCDVLIEKAKDDKDIVVLCSDSRGSASMTPFANTYPEQFVEAGIAEQSLVSIAAGLATCGKIPFAASFAMFSAGRAFEQVRNSVCYPKLNVKIVGSHAGISVGEDGATHQCCEDIALMRAIPGMTVINPCDHYEMIAAVKAMAEKNGPCYVRLGRLAVESVNNNDDYKFELGKGITLKDGSDITIVATGLLVQEAVKAAKVLSDEGINARVLNIHTIKPLDEELIIKAAKETGRIVTCEEHNVVGGLGEAVSSLLCEKYPVPVTKIGVNDVFGHSGPAVDLLKQFGLSADNIVATVKKVLGK